jgi:hypothetical protein
MPYPLDAKIDGTYKNGRWVDRKDKSASRFLLTATAACRARCVTSAAIRCDRDGV